MRQGTAFTKCPRCGNTSRLPVITCSKCFYDATPPAFSAPILGYSLILLLAVVVVGAFAWQRYMAGPPAFLGTWKSERATFIFAADGGLKADAYFDPGGGFHATNKMLKQSWSVLAGDLLTLERFSTDGKNEKMTSHVQWTIGPSGKTLTLKGVGRTDNLVSEITLRKKPDG